MGLCDELMKINRNQREQENNLKEIKRIENKKQREREQKQYEKDIGAACKKELRYKFNEGFEEKGINAKFDYYNIETRNKIIKEIAKTEFEGDCLEDNYNKILNETIKKYELNQKYLEEQQRIEDEKQKQEAEQYMEKMAPIFEKHQKGKNVKRYFKNAGTNILKFIVELVQHPFVILFIIVLIYAIYFIYNVWQLAQPILNS